MIAMQNGQVPGQPGDGGSPPGTPGVPSQAVPPNMQQGAPSVPANQDKTTAVVNQLRNASASVNAGNGASPPNPQ